MGGDSISSKANNCKMYKFPPVKLISAVLVFLMRSHISLWQECVDTNISSMCGLQIFFFYLIHHMACQRKSAVYYLVFLDIWLLLFRAAPTLILLITLTNIASPLWHKSKHDFVVAPSLGSNLNVSAGVNSGTENLYGFCVYSLQCCKLPDIVWS